MTRSAVFKFRLYVADSTQNSMQAVANLNAMCVEHLPDRHEIEVIDVFKEPLLALADSVFMTPTLIKVGPSPAGRIVGTLSQTRTVLQALGVAPTAVPA